MAEPVSIFISDIVSAIANISLYSSGHAAVAFFSEKALKDMEGLYKDGSLSMTILGDSLLCNDARLQERGLHIDNFAKKMKGRGIEKIIFRKGLTAAELIKFLSDIVAGATVALAASEHISLGVVEVGLKGGGGGGSGLKQVVAESTPKLEEATESFRKFRKLDMVGLEEVVSGFISTMRSELNVLTAISPVKSHSEYTFTHATNVSILSMYQAQTLGIGGETLHEIGVAGLLHDMGKMFVATEILEKPGKLDPHEWDEMKKHPAYGARYLSTLDDVPELSLIAAFEHHMKFDGTGYPDTVRRGKKQHIISQIVAVADFFDALRTERPYRKALDIPVIFGLLKEARGKDFNPVLVDSFMLSGKGIFKSEEGKSQEG